MIYRTADGGWTTDLAGAAVVTTAPAAQDLLKGAVADDVGAVGPYVAPVELTPDQRRAAGQSARAHPRRRPDHRAARRFAA